MKVVEIREGMQIKIIPILETVRNSPIILRWGMPRGRSIRVGIQGPIDEYRITNAVEATIPVFNPRGLVLYPEYAIMFVPTFQNQPDGVKTITIRPGVSAVGFWASRDASHIYAEFQAECYTVTGRLAAEVNGQRNMQKIGA